MTTVHVGNSGARNPDGVPPAHPRFERELEVFPSPHKEPWIVPTEFFEPLSADREKTAGVGGGIVRLAMMLPTCLFLLRHIALLIKHPPFEQPPGMAVPSVHGVDGEIAPVDAVDDRHGQGSLVLVNGGQKGREPVVAHLAVSIQEDDHLQRDKPE